MFRSHVFHFSLLHQRLRVVGNQHEAILLASYWRTDLWWSLTYHGLTSMVCVFFVARIVWTNVRFGYGLRKSLLKKVAKVPQVDSERCVYHVLICPAKRRVLIAIWSQSAHLVPMLQGVLSWELFVRSTQWIHQVVIYRNFFSPKDK